MMCPVCGGPLRRQYQKTCSRACSDRLRFRDGPKARAREALERYHPVPLTTTDLMYEVGAPLKRTQRIVRELVEEGSAVLVGPDPDEPRSSVWAFGGAS